MTVAKRAADRRSDDHANTWLPVRRSAADPRAVAEPWTAEYRCPYGHDGLLDDHMIDPGGRVEPSVICPGYPANFREPGAPAEPCIFHDSVRLEGWPP